MATIHCSFKTMFSSVLLKFNKLISFVAFAPYLLHVVLCII